MTVREMIAVLQGFDPDAPLLVDGYEGGFERAEGARVVAVKPFNGGALFGDYQDARDAASEEGSIKAVVVSGRSCL